jgi:hypothetical protein
MSVLTIISPAPSQMMMMTESSSTLSKHSHLQTSYQDLTIWLPMHYQENAVSSVPTQHQRNQRRVVSWALSALSERVPGRKCRKEKNHAHIETMKGDTPQKPSAKHPVDCDAMIGAGDLSDQTPMPKGS